MPPKIEDINELITDINIGAEAIGQEFGTDLQQLSVINSGNGEDTINDIKDDIEPTEPPAEPIEPPETPPIVSPEDQILQNEIEDLKTDEELAIEEAKRIADAKEAERIALWDDFKTQLGKDKEAQIEVIKSHFSQLRAKQDEINRRRTRLEQTVQIRFSGRFRPSTAADLVQEKIEIGEQKIQELLSEERSAISSIQSAFTEKKYTEALNNWEDVQKIRKERDEVISNIEQAQIEGLNLLREEEKNQRETIKFAKEQERETIESISSLVLNSLGDDDAENAKIIANFAKQYEIDPNFLLNSILELDQSIEEQKAKSGGNLKFISGTAKQQGGVFNPVTGQFTPLKGGFGGTPTGATSGKITKADLAFTTNEEDLTITRVMRLLPTKLKDSEQEREDRKVEVLRGIRSGQTVQDIVDEIKGFVITNEAEGDLAMYLRTLSAGSDIDLSDLSAAINRNQMKKAMTIVENENLKDAEGELSNTVSAKTLVQNANRVLDLLAKAPIDNLGEFDGRKFKVEKFFGLSDKEALATQQLETAMVNLLNEIRRKSLGTAVTEAEIKFLEPLLTDLLDQPEFIKTKVGELKVGTLRQHNEARGQTTLPHISEDELLNTEQRLQTYRDMANQSAKIRVRLQDGQIGTIDENDFDPNTMEKI